MQLPLTKASLLIGRGSACDLRLDDRSVSRQHARLRYAQGAWFIQDQGSRGGTYVNGAPVTACRLNSGDVIKIGNTSLIFRA
jgi:pSer/pThr/pTyr-binding forkhead associated (FHA) protein